MTVLVLGYSGQLASHLRRRLPDAVFFGRAELDLSAVDTIAPAVRALAPSLIINAAAYTAVDGAEKEPEAAWTINVAAPAALAMVAQDLGIPLVHVSTDYVFYGNAKDPYTRDADTHPINTYGRTKLAGELAVATLCHQYWILRASWIFSEFGKNFVKTMLRVGAERDTLEVVSDQYGRPTYAGDLAAIIEKLATLAGDTNLAWGTYHAVGGPIVSWYEFARVIFRQTTERNLLQEAPAVNPIATVDYPTPAPRPLRAVLDPSGELTAATGLTPDWQAGVDETLAQLA